MAWTAPRTWVAGEIVTAAQMNEQVRDNEVYLKTTQDEHYAELKGNSGQIALNNSMTQSGLRVLLISEGAYTGQSNGGAQSITHGLGKVFTTAIVTRWTSSGGTGQQIATGIMTGCTSGKAYVSTVVIMSGQTPTSYLYDASLKSTVFYVTGDLNESGVHYTWQAQG